MVKKLLSMIAVAAAAFGLSSCLNTKDPEIVQRLSDDVVIINTVTGTQTTGRMTLAVDINKKTAELSMPVIYNGKEVNAVFKDVKVTNEANLGYRYTATSVQAVDGNGMSLGFSIEDLDGYLQVVQGSEESFRNIGMLFMLNNEYINVTCADITFPITSTLTSIGDSGYECKNATYQVKFNILTNTADIIIKKIQFVAASPTLSEITIPSVPYTITTQGFALNASEITPTSSGVPMDSRKITNLELTVNTHRGTYVGSFNCMGMLCTTNGKIYEPVDTEK